MDEKSLKQYIEEIGLLQNRIAELEIVDNKRKQEAARIRCLATVVKNSNDAIIIQDFKGQIIAWNHGAELMYGYSEKEALQMNIGRLTHPDKVTEQKEFTRRLIAGETIASFGTQRVVKDGRILDVWLTVTKLVDDTGKPVGIASTERDITERKNHEDQIRYVAKEWRTTFDSTTDLISIIDRDFKIIRANKAFANTFRLEPKEVIGRICYELVHGTKEPHPDCPRKGVLLTKKPVISEFFDAFLNKYLQVSVSPMPNDNGDMANVVHLMRDTTERKKVEEELRVAYKKLKQIQQELIQASKMATMGQLAAGISHELNQPLTGIKGFAQAVLMDLEKESPLRKDLNKIVEQADKMDAIIKNVRFFSRKADFNMSEIDINQVILNSLALLSQQLKTHNIRVIQELGPDIPKIQGDPNQLQQAFLNIISNARDAIIGFNRTESRELRIHTALNRDKDHIEITFQDTGGGIPEKSLQHMFTPFFTTKSPDGGMGLGLSITYRIIENHQGKIDFQSKAGEGTTFRIVLPLKGKNIK